LVSFQTGRKRDVCIKLDIYLLLRAIFLHIIEHVVFLSRTYFLWVRLHLETNKLGLISIPSDSLCICFIFCSGAMPCNKVGIHWDIGWRWERLQRSGSYIIIMFFFISTTIHNLHCTNQSIKLRLFSINH
jgi:hypothetical protein